MESILEQQRRLHEERERLMDTMVKETVHKKSSHRENINSEHRLKMQLDEFMESTSHLYELYEDNDGQRRAEIQALSGPNEFDEFYKRLKSIKEFHRRHPVEICAPMSTKFDEWKQMREKPTEEDASFVYFTDEEGYGKHLDLNECYQRYINLKGVEKVDYIAYLSTFDHLFDIPKDRKNADYRRYVETLLTYLIDFLGRVRPLLDVNAELAKANNEFEIQWVKHDFPGWPRDPGSSALTNVGAHLDLSAFTAWEELASLGLDRLKSALMALGLKCGGTLEERAQRLFSTKGEAYLDPTMLAKKSHRKFSKNSKHAEKQKEMARLEAQVYKISEFVESQRMATKENVQRKQARTDEERADSDAEVSAEDSDDEDDNEAPYNPKNLPLGWDGKPIPYWLYKLHGLNVSYSCEICGNYTYNGPKAYQRHFTEWRHAHGMRCLKIPNTAHFANVTRIEDALALWEKVQATGRAERWQPEQEEEYEDSLGNVVNRKTYEDLKRQGLL